MKTPENSSGFSKLLPAFAGLLMLGIAVIVFLLPTDSEKPQVVLAPENQPTPVQPELQDSRITNAPVNPPVRPEVIAAQGRRFDWFTTRPFAVEKSSVAHEWTKEDGTRIEAISAIAHNQAEVQRLVEENPRIERRQLIYRKEPAFVLVQQARGTGAPLQKLTLPGLDGREFEMEIVSSDLSPSGLKGTFSGRLPGRGLSMVTLAFKEGREAFSIISPEDGIYLQAHPREPGEIILTSFNPDKYQPLPGAEPIRTTAASAPRK